MANSLTTQILEDGDRNAVVKVVGVVDSSDLAYTVIVDPASYTPNLGKFRVDVIKFTVESGLTVRLYWDAAVPVVMHTFDGAGKNDARRFGGLQNDAVSPSGRIAVQTEGWANPGVLSFSMTLQLVKQINPTTDFFLMKEDGSYLLQENGYGIILE